MLPVLFVSLLAVSGNDAAALAPGRERADNGVGFALIDKKPGAQENERIYRVRMTGDGRDAGILKIACDNKELVGASFVPKARPLSGSPSRLDDGNAVVRAAGNRLCD